MSLINGDYLAAENKVSETLYADSGPGGMRETGNPAVALIEPEIRDEPKLYGAHELPVIAVSVTGKTEEFEPNAKTIGKVFHLAFHIICRGADRDQADRQLKCIAHRLESLVREQSATDKQFSGLPGQIADADGVLVASIQSTCFSAQKPAGTNMDYTVSAQVLADLWIPVSLNL